MAERQFDKLNASYKNRAIPYDQYFGEMDISKEQEEQRTDAAKDFEEDILFFLFFVSLISATGYSDYSSATDQFVSRYRANVSKYIDDADFLSWYPTLYATEMLDTTLQNIVDPWYLSEDRAMFNAENEANTVLNRSDFLNAVLSGKRHKKWIDIRDKRERKTHLKVGCKVIPIGEPFEVGNDLMMYPKDLTYDPSASEVVNCRCSVLYLR